MDPIRKQTKENKAVGPEFRIFHLANIEKTKMPRGRGYQQHIVNAECGAKALDVHLNILNPKEPGGHYHHHTMADNVYIVREGEGRLVINGETHTIRQDDVVYIPAGIKHSLTNVSDKPFEIFEIYGPAGDDFDFVLDEEDYRNDT